jgi:hypothetical protein
VVAYEGIDPEKLISMPRLLLNLLIEHMPRVEARKSLREAAVALFPHLSDEDRSRQLTAWQFVARVVSAIESAIQSVLWTGEVEEGEVPGSVLVADDYEDVEGFFAIMGLA